MKLLLLNTDTVDPYENLALEEHLVRLAGNGTILYLWQNAHTVVIGRNQNAMRDVNLARLRMDGGRLARRLSGGGAVYHDLGNLNFTFVLPRREYDLARQTQVVLEAARAVGVPAVASGRNDLTTKGRKFSGNAFYRRGGAWFHHGTLLVDADLDALGVYLNVSQEKLRARGAPSVRGRVCNLSEFSPGLDTGVMRQAMAEAFARVYGGNVERFDAKRIDWNAVEEIRGRISSESYLFGERMPFDCRLERRFPWGEIQLSLCVRSGVVTACGAHSDAMEEEEIARLPLLLTGCSVHGEAFRKALAGWGVNGMGPDVLTLLMEL